MVSSSTKHSPVYRLVSIIVTTRKRYDLFGIQVLLFGLQFYYVGKVSNHMESNFFHNFTNRNHSYFHMYNLCRQFLRNNYTSHNNWYYKSMYLWTIGKWCSDIGLCNTKENSKKKVSLIVFRSVLFFLWLSSFVRCPTKWGIWILSEAKSIIIKFNYHFWLTTHINAEFCKKNFFQPKPKAILWKSTAKFHC